MKAALKNGCDVRSDIILPWSASRYSDDDMIIILFVVLFVKNQTKAVHNCTFQMFIHTIEQEP